MSIISGLTDFFSRDRLPSRYQIVEEEDHKGRTGIYLYISPSAGDVPEKDVVDTVLNALRQCADEKRSNPSGNTKTTDFHRTRQTHAASYS